MRIQPILWFSLWVILAGFHIPAPQNTANGSATFYVATDGSNTTGDGSLAQPWATITFALDNVPDGSQILVQPGVYDGRVRIRGNFANGVTVASAQPYQAVLQHTGTVLTVWNDSDDVAGITISGFELRHSGPGASALVVQVQDGFNTQTHNITFANNIMHDSYNNDILKINNGAADIQVLNNLFYNQSGSDEHIDINSVDNVLVEGNVFFNDFAASGRDNPNNTSSYIVVKDSNADNDEYLGARNVTVRRNIFMHWQGSSGSNFVLCGEDGQGFYETENMLIENNLMLGDAANTMRAAVGVKGCRDVAVRANTVRGNLPSLAYAMRLNREGANLQNLNIQFYNNWWADSSGTMDDFSDTPPSDTASFTLSNNAYWNGGNSLPDSSTDLINPSDDAQGLQGDPLFTQPLDMLSTPYWRAGQGVFRGGATSIAQVFQTFAMAFGTNNGVGVDSADPLTMPADDLLGNPRDNNPDIGAVEASAVATILRDGFEAQ